MAMRIATPKPTLSLPSSLLPNLSFNAPSSLSLRRRRHFQLLAAAAPLSRPREEEDDVFEEMQQWVENKPRGFGEGKRYDTTLEDQLWEEMERSRKGNELAKLKLKEGRKDMEKKQKEVSVISYAAQVRLWNLPRKKNILRDLQLAFKGFPGIVNISPAVLGNEKTRDPICKGFAFVDLNSEEAANRFVQIFSQKSLVFGKVEKQISCTIVNTHNAPGKDGDKPARSDIELHSEIDVNSISFNVSNKSHLSKGKESSSSHSKEALGETLCRIVKNNSGNESDVEVSISDPDESTVSSKNKKNKGPPKRKGTKKKQPDASKLALSGSFSRLKVKERSVLTGILSGVLTKYNAEAAAENR